LENTGQTESLPFRIKPVKKNLKSEAVHLGVMRMTGIHLEKICPEDNCFRYYEISVEPNLFGDSSLIIRWGRIGRLGRERIAKSGSQGDLAVHAAVLARGKCRRGYAPAE
jgi:predicted DNA-binding WGR domain protein